jgi:ATP-dependent Clp protease protease subunit
MTFPFPTTPPTRPGWPAPSPHPAPDLAFGRPAQDDWLYRQLMERRIVLAQGTLDATLATRLCAQLLTLDAEGDEPIQFHLHSPDGEVGAALTVVDALDALRVPVHAVAVGAVGGPGIGVLVAAGQRSTYPHASFHLTEPRTQTQGTAGEVAAHEANHRGLVDDLYERIAQVTGRSAEQVRDDARQGRYLNATEAVDYGLVERITPR